MTKPPKTEAVLIRLTPEQKAAYQAQGGAKWVRALIDALTDAVLIRLTPEQKSAYQAQGGAEWVRAMIDALIRGGVKK